MGASIWEGSTVIQSTANADNSFLTQRFVPTTEGQTLFVITEFQYAPGTNSLEVRVNGVDQVSGTDFSETSSTSFTFISGGVNPRDVVDVRGVVGTTGVPQLLEEAEEILEEAQSTLAAVIILRDQTQAIYDAALVLTPATLPLSIINGGTGTNTKTNAFDALSPTTTKGDLVVYNGTDNIRVAVGANRQRLEADSAQASGVKWSYDYQTVTARAANTQLVAADSGRLYSLTGTFTQTFDTALNLGAGWFVELENAGTGNITIPSSDGMTNWIMYPQERRTFYSDGAAITSRVERGFNATFATTGPLLKCPGYTYVEGEMWNGGNSGQCNTGTASGGGGGGCFPFKIPTALLAATETITVGAGGIGNSNTGFDGGTGGASSIGTLIVMQVGGAGNFQQGTGIVFRSSSGPVGFEAASVSGGVAALAIYGGGVSNQTTGSIGGSSIFGGGAGGSLNASNVPMSPGTSKIGGNGGVANTAANGAAGAIPGGGGGACGAGFTAGNGGRGEVRIRGVV